eukprot:gb/GEZN01002168.1/.p1 GENE.gb/GEZN01002168.1/~~gb/GEZN01002168.1/.p1  ORF type:complete len:659 (-),score=76.95 gb/GEZN01002168.1/:568-2544(-)
MQSIESVLEKRPPVRALAELSVILHSYRVSSVLRSKWTYIAALSSVGFALSWLSSYQRKVVLQAVKSLYFAFRSKSIRNILIASFTLSFALKALGLGTFKQRFIASFLFLWALFYRYNVVEHPRLRYHRTFWNVHIVEKARLTKEPFSPVYWGFNRHAQTIVCFVLQVLESHIWSQPVSVREEIIRVPVSKRFTAKGNWNGPGKRDFRADSSTTNMNKGDYELQYLHWYYEKVSTSNEGTHSRCSSEAGDHRKEEEEEELVAQDEKNKEENDEEGLSEDRLLPAVPDEDDEEQTRIAQEPWQGRVNEDLQLEESLKDKSWRDDTPIMFMIHGLGDDKNHPYMRRWAKMSRKLGWRAVAFSYWRIDFHNTRDLEVVLNHVANSYPRAPIIAVAWSAGGHLLGSYLGQVGKRTPLVGAVIRSGCWNFRTAVGDIERNENSAYQFFLQMQTLECCRRHLQYDKHISDAKRAQLEKLLSLSSLLLNPLSLYDRFIFQHGKYSYKRKEQHNLANYIPFENTREHWEHCAERYIPGIGITTLVLQARDDPVVSNAHVRWKSLWNNKHVITLHTKRGGHVSWFEGWFPIGPSFSDRVSANFVSALLESHAQTNFLVDVIRRTLKQNAAPLNPASMARICSASDLSMHWKSAANLRSLDTSTQGEE